MRYTSTRADIDAGFIDTIAGGLGQGGGLSLPMTWPRLGRGDLARCVAGGYGAAIELVGAAFAGDSVPAAVWRAVAAETVAAFRHPAVAPLSEIGQRRWLLELFHGPTLSFKDYGLQPLARLLAAIAADCDRPLLILGATSGDTGSAGLAAFAEAPNARIAILHPEGRVSEIQRRQMTTLAGEHIRNIAVEGSFDDCQRIVKALLAERAARNAETVLSVNSINWGRLLFQCAYHVYTAARLARGGAPIAVVVPSGNFGNALSAMLAAGIGAPIAHLIVATNANDRLTEILNTGETAAGPARPTLSPAMDIQVPSNLERLIYLAAGEDAGETAAIMARAGAGGPLRMPEGWHARLPVTIEAHAIDDAATLTAIRETYARTDRIIDPHTAVAVAAADRARDAGEAQTVVVATAHPAKFPEAVEAALGFRPPVPAPLAAMLSREERYRRCGASEAAVREAIFGRDG